MNQLWHQLLGTALVGTDRQSPAMPEGEAPLVDVVRQLDWQQPAAALLKTAGAFAVYQQVGHEATTDSQTVPLADIDPALPETLPSCSPQIAEHLKVGLSRYPQAVAELLSLMAAAEKGVPYVQIPAVLRYGETHVAAQVAVEAVVGIRGRWLAAQNADWRYVRTGSGAVSEAEVAWWGSQWQRGNHSQRLLAIQQWRRVDPEGAREAIAATWSSESRQIRSGVIDCFVDGLTMADEPFLEAALTDRTLAVRQSAARWLARLPASRLCQRMIARVQKFVQLASTASQLSVEITLPEAFDSNWAQDGICKDAVSGLSEPASWLQQLIARTPLTLWQPAIAQHGWDTFSNMLSTHLHRKMLIDGWAQAVCNQRQYTYSCLWVPALLHQFDAYQWEKTVLSTLLSSLSSPHKEQYLREQVPQKANDHNIAHWLRLVAEDDPKWDYDFSRLVLDQLMQVLKRKYKYGDLFSPPGSLALALHPGIAPEAQRLIEGWRVNQRPTKSWKRFLDEFVGVLIYRWQMYQLFAGSG